MIRTKNKIYAEENDPNTVSAQYNLLPQYLIIGDNNKRIRTFGGAGNAIFITDENGIVQQLSFNGQTNRVIGTDGEGNIILIRRGDI